MEKKKATVKKAVESKKKNPCDDCMVTYDSKKSFCRSCVNYRG
jgi:hypothetical protein